MVEPPSNRWLMNFERSVTRTYASKTMSKHSSSVLCALGLPTVFTLILFYSYIGDQKSVDITHGVHNVLTEQAEVSHTTSQTTHLVNHSSYIYEHNKLTEKALLVVKYKGGDLMKERRPTFDPQFKNPCWYETSGRSSKLRCLPYFYLIGVKKCGTTFLFGEIKRHPDFATGSDVKEIHWFERKRFKAQLSNHDNITSYIKEFDGAAKQIQNSHHRITGDGTPGYLHMNFFWRHLPGNEGATEPRYVILDYIRHVNPAAKIIVVFRDPVTRLYSDFFHTFLKTKKPLNPSSFHKLVQYGLRLYQDCFRHFSVRSCVYNATIFRRTKINIQLGIYYVYWQELMRVFRRQQIFVVHNTDLKANPVNTLAEVFRFLDMSPLDRSRLETIASEGRSFTRAKTYKTVGGMLNETTVLLQNFYKPFNQMMFEITHDNHFLYTY